VVEISEFFCTSSQTSEKQDPMVTYVKKVFFSKIWYLY